MFETCMQRKNYIRSKTHQKTNGLDFSVKTTKITSISDEKVKYIFFEKNTSLHRYPYLRITGIKWNWIKILQMKSFFSLCNSVLVFKFLVVWNWNLAQKDCSLHITSNQNFTMTSNNRLFLHFKSPKWLFFSVLHAGHLIHALSYM